MNTKILLAATLTSLLIAGQTAMAGQDVERDEFSIGVVWNADTTLASTDRVNYSIQAMDEEASALDKELFPESEGQ